MAQERLGIRSHNPGNVKHAGWRGTAEVIQADGGAYAVFENDMYGTRAMMLNMHTKMFRDDANTPNKLAEVWAVSNGGTDGFYARKVASAAGFRTESDLGTNRELDFSDVGQMYRVFRKIERHENGRHFVSNKDVIDGFFQAYQYRGYDISREQIEEVVTKEGKGVDIRAGAPSTYKLDQEGLTQALQTLDKETLTKIFDNVKTYAKEQGSEITEAPESKEEYVELIVKALATLTSAGKITQDTKIGDLKLGDYFTHEQQRSHRSSSQRARDRELIDERNRKEHIMGGGGMMEDAFGLLVIAMLMIAYGGKDGLQAAMSFLNAFGLGLQNSNEPLGEYKTTGTGRNTSYVDAEWIQERWENFKENRKDGEVLHTSPVLGDAQITSPFGKRNSPKDGASTYHKAHDMGWRDEGTPWIGASAPGVVEFAGWAKGYGNTIRIRHADGSVTQYGHLARFEVESGEIVGRRQRIGVMGSTGVSTGLHLDYKQFAPNGEEQIPEYVGYGQVNERIRISHETSVEAFNKLILENEAKKLFAAANIRDANGNGLFDEDEIAPLFNNDPYATPGKTLAVVRAQMQKAGIKVGIEATTAADISQQANQFLQKKAAQVAAVS